jgi:ADP-ribose pyrophosphatase
MNTEQPQPWQQLSSRVLFDHPRFGLVEDTVELPSGRRTGWVSLRDGRDFVKLICVDEQRRVLVARQYCHPPRRVVGEFPGGIVEQGEDDEQAARRELQEEVGLFPRALRSIGTFLTNTRRSAITCRVYVATGLEQRPHSPDGEEFIAYEWLAIPALEQQIRAGAQENGVLLAAWVLFRLNCPEFF